MRERKGERECVYERERERERQRGRLSEDTRITGRKTGNNKMSKIECDGNTEERGGKKLILYI